MILKDYVKIINALLENNPELKDCHLVYASDDEGNSYDAVHYTPSIGFVDENQEFETYENLIEEYGEIPDNWQRVICIN